MTSGIRTIGLLAKLLLDHRRSNKVTIETRFQLYSSHIR
jgi:hypothetical protein